jgi:hypothetical protein
MSDNTPEQVMIFPTREVAAAYIFAFTPPTGFVSRLSLGRPVWVLHVGEDTLNKCLQLGDLVYVDRDNNYAGSAIVGEIYLEESMSLGYMRLLVQDMWKYCLTGTHKAFFYLLVLQHHYMSDQHKICPGQWVVSSYNHKEINCHFQNSTCQPTAIVITPESLRSLGCRECADFRFIRCTEQQRTAQSCRL